MLHLLLGDDLSIFILCDSPVAPTLPLVSNSDVTQEVLLRNMIWRLKCSPPLIVTSDVARGVLLRNMNWGLKSTLPMEMKLRSKHRRLQLTLSLARDSTSLELIVGDQCRRLRLDGVWRGLAMASLRRCSMTRDSAHVDGLLDVD